MPELLLYEYAVIKIVPRMERGEFINAGVLLFCKKNNIILCELALNIEKIKMLHSEADTDTITRNISAFQHIALGEVSCLSPMAKLPPAARFRWLTATRSTILQCSKVHPGYSHDLNHTITQLLNNLVL